MSKSKKIKATEARRKVGVIVLGMHRSGTSALSGVLTRLGCDAPSTLMPPHPSNSKGFYESQVLYKLNAEILETAGSKWSDWQAFNTGWFNSPKADLYRERVQASLQAEFPDSRLFVLKDPRLCRLLPLYLEAFDALGIQPALVHIHRNPLDVAASLEARDGLDPDVTQLIWLRHILDAESNSRQLPRTFVTYDQLMQNWAGLTDRLGKRLGLQWPRLSATAAAEIDDFLTPGLKHHENPKAQVLENPMASAWVREAYATVQRWADTGERPADHATLDEISQAFGPSASLFGRLVTKGRAAADRATQIEKELATLRSEAGKQKTELTERVAELAEHKAALAKHSDDLTAREAELVKATATLQDKDRQLAELVARTGQQTEAIAEAKAALAARETTLRETEAALQDKGAKVAALDAQLAQQRLAHDQAKADLAARETTLRETQAALQDKGAKVAALDAQLAQQRLAHDQAKAELAARETTLRETEAALQEKGAKVAALDAQLAQQKLAHDQAKADLAARETTLRETEAALQAAVTAREAAEDVAETLRAQITALEDERAQLTSMLRQRQHEASDWAAKAEQAEAALDQSRSAAERLTQDLGVLARDLSQSEDALEAAAKAHAAQLAGLQAELARVQTLAEAERKAASAQKAQTDRLNAEIALLARDLTQTEDAAKAERGRAERAEREADALRHTVQDQSKDIAALQTRLKEAETLARSQAEAAAAHLARSAEEIAHLHHVRDALLSSTSWKITAPLRRVITVLRGGRG